MKRVIILRGICEARFSHLLDISRDVADVSWRVDGGLLQG